MNGVGGVGATMELNGKGQNSDEQLSAALEEMGQYKQELENALENSNARLMSAEKELLEVREQYDDAKALLLASAAREKGMEGQLAGIQKQLDQATRDLEKERKHWNEQYQAEKDMAEQLKGTLEVLRLQLESEGQKHIDELEQHRLAWVAKEKELWGMVDAARSAAAAAAYAAAKVADAAVTDIPMSVESMLSTRETDVMVNGSAKVADEPAEEREKQTVIVEMSQEKVTINTAAYHEVDVDLKKSDPDCVLLKLDGWVSPSKGSGASSVAIEPGLNLQGALSRLQAMQEIQEKWRKQVERMDEVESEWKGRLTGLEQERDDLIHEVELMQEDLRREQDLAMEAGMVAEEEWRKRQEAERAMAELQREVAKQKKVAREALMCIPRATLDQNSSTGGGIQGGSPMVRLALSDSADVEANELKLVDGDGAEGQIDRDKCDRFAFDLLMQQAAHEEAGDTVQTPRSVASSESFKDRATDDVNLTRVRHSGSTEGGDVREKNHDQEQKFLDAQESLLRLGQEVGTLRKEVLELRMKLAEVRDQVQRLESEKQDLARKHAFGQVCLELVTNSKDKFEEQIAMATRHALEASQKARETDKQLFALLADIASLLKEHQVQAKNNGSTYNKYKIGRKEIDIVKEDLRQLVKFVQMKATLAEKGRQRNKTKAAADAARPRLAELRDGAAQEEEVLAELEKELDEARKRTEEAEKMHSMVAAMREKERQVRESVEKEVRAVQAKMQEAEIMKQQVEALKQTEQVLAKELAEEVKELKVKSLEAEEVEGRISALEATEMVIRQEMEAKTMRVREIDRQFPRLMGLGLGSELPPPGLLGRKPQEELAWKDKRKVLEDLKVMKEQLIWTQSSLLKSRQRLPELIQEAKECKRRVEEKEKENKRVQQWLKDHDAGLTAARGGGDGDGLRKSIASTWSWWKRKDEYEVPSRLSGMPIPRVHPMGTLLPLGSNSSDEQSDNTPSRAPSNVNSPAKRVVASSANASVRPGQAVGNGQGLGSPAHKGVAAAGPSSPSLTPLEDRRSSESSRSSMKPGSPTPWPLPSKRLQERRSQELADSSRVMPPELLILPKAQSERRGPVVETLVLPKAQSEKREVGGVSARPAGPAADQPSLPNPDLSERTSTFGKQTLEGAVVASRMGSTAGVHEIRIADLPPMVVLPQDQG